MECEIFPCEPVEILMNAVPMLPVCALFIGPQSAFAAAKSIHTECLANG
jgi:hypothetical protein